VSSRAEVDGDGREVVLGESGHVFRVLDVTAVGFEPEGRPANERELDKPRTRGYMSPKQHRDLREGLDPFRVYDPGQLAHERWIARPAEACRPRHRPQNDERPQERAHVEPGKLTKS
jgi:hypothetical protein